MYTKEQQMSEALRQQEQKRKETERQAFQNHTNTIQEIEQLRRRNKDLSESVQSLTHALQTLTGSGEKRMSHGTKNNSSKKVNLKRSRQEQDDTSIYQESKGSDNNVHSFTSLD